VCELQHIAQSAVSEQIRRLEQALGVRLFERSSRHVRLTPAGRALLPKVRTVLKELDAIEALAQNWEKGSAAELVVSYSGHVGTDFIPAVVAEVETRYPDIVIILREQLLTDLLVGLGDPQVDVAITWSPLDSSVDGLTSEVLIIDGAVAVFPAAHPLARLNAISAAQLAKEHVLQWPGSPTRFTRRTAENEQLPSTTAETLTAVAVGRGIAIAPRSLSRSFNWPDVVYVPVTGPPTTELALAWRTTVASDAVAKFIDTARLAAVRSQ